MNITPQPRFPPTSERSEPFRAGTSRRGYAQRLIGQVQALCASWLELPLQSCLMDAEQRLFERAWQDPDYIEQQACTTARRCLQSHREQLEQRFAAQMIQRFERLGSSVDKDAPGAPSQSTTLSLVASGEDDERALLDQIHARSEARHASLLFELGYRLGVLAGHAPLAGEQLPLSTQAMSRTFIDTLHEQALPTPQRVLSLQAFDHTIVHELASLYETINQHLMDAGILPHLRAYRVARPGDPRSPGATEGGAVEQRRAQRKHANHAVAVADLVHGGSLGRLGNLSAGGLLLIGPLPPASGAVYQVSVALPDLRPDHASTAVIELGIQEQWQDATAAIGQIWSGFRIISISPADAALLEAWLALPGGQG